MLGLARAPSAPLLFPPADMASFSLNNIDMLPAGSELVPLSALLLPDGLARAFAIPTFDDSPSEAGRPTSRSFSADLDAALRQGGLGASQARAAAGGRRRPPRRPRPSPPRRCRAPARRRGRRSRRRHAARGRRRRRRRPGARAGR